MLYTAESHKFSTPNAMHQLKQCVLVSNRRPKHTSTIRKYTRKPKQTNTTHCKCQLHTELAVCKKQSIMLNGVWTAMHASMLHGLTFRVYCSPVRVKAWPPMTKPILGRPFTKLQSIVHWMHRKEAQVMHHRGSRTPHLIYIPNTGIHVCTCAYI